MSKRSLGIFVFLLGVGASQAPQLAEAQNAAFSIRLRAELTVRNPAEPARSLQPLPLVHERVRAEIDGQHAVTTLRQVFRNQTGARLEGRYVLRPTIDARVDGFAYYIGEERVEGEVLERQTARAVYNEVTRPTVARDPAILEQTGDGEFTFQVFPIEPGEDKRIEIRTAEWLVRRGSQVTYRVPMASSGGRAEIVIRDPRARNVRSTTHAIEIESIEGGLRVRARDPRTGAGELVVRWQIRENAWQPRVFLHRDESHPGYFIASLAAPDGFGDQVAAKDVTLVLDHSGSMAGEAIVHARAAASDIVERLGPEDGLNVIAFDDDVDPLYARARRVNVDTRAAALRFINELHPGGGTDIAYAMRRALDSQRGNTSRPQVVIFVTDGRSDPAGAIRVAETHRIDARVFTVGVGSGVNRPLLSRIAALKRGTFTFIDRPSRIEREIGHLYAQIARPLLVDVSLEVEGANAYALYPRTIPDLFVHDELVITGRFRGGRGPIRFVVSGRLGDREVRYHTTASVGTTSRRPWVGRRWAIGRVDHLLEEINLGNANTELRQEVVSLALAYNFVTPFTSFLAIPEREVTAAARADLDRGRAQRNDAHARHADATALTTETTAGGSAAFQGRFRSRIDAFSAAAPRRSELQARIQVQQRSVMNAERSPAPDDMVEMVESDEESFGGGGGADSVQYRNAPTSVAMGDSSAAGCASCSIGSGRAQPLGFVVAFLLICALVRRRLWSER